MTDVSGSRDGVPGAGDGLRVLVIHNRYRSALPSGENTVVDREIDLLRRAGVEVSTWIRSSDEIPDLPLPEKLTLPLRPIWSRRDTAALTGAIERERPHLVHLHNPYPLVSPAVVRVAARHGVPVVQTVHNYRHSCLNGLHLRDGEVCTLCVGRRLALPGVRHGCYRGSRPQSAVLATAEAVHHGTWRLVSLYLALSDFMADQLVASGIDRDRIAVRANFVDDPGPPVPAGAGFLFAGRLEDAKGIGLLLDAWESSGLDGLVPLVVAGDGPMRAEVAARAARLQSVDVLGAVPREEMAGRFRACAAVVVPSLCFEGLPTVILEAFAHGRPVLATAVGALPEVVADGLGWVSRPAPAALADALRAAHERPIGGEAPRRAFEHRYTSEVATGSLLAAYRTVLGRSPLDDER